MPMLSSPPCVVAGARLGEYTREYMPTSVHIPATLLQALDERAKALRVSRNSLIVKAIERDLGVDRGWPQGFFESLAVVDDDDRAAIDETIAKVIKRRSSKLPIDL